MIEINGKCNSAKVYTGALDEKSREQIETLCDQTFVSGSTMSAILTAKILKVINRIFAAFRRENAKSVRKVTDFVDRH